MAEEANLGFGKVDALGGFEQLNHCLPAFDFKHFAAPDLAVGEFQLAELVVGDVFNPVDNHQRACDFFYCFIFFDHLSFPPAATALISASISFRMAS